LSDAAGVSLRVECYAGYRADERPEAFWFQARRIAVRRILDRWLGEDHAYFKLMGEDGVLYILRRDDRCDRWELILTKYPTSPITEARG
jgi:hypothetical protein